MEHRTKRGSQWAVFILAGLLAILSVLAAINFLITAFVGDGDNSASNWLILSVSSLGIAAAFGALAWLLKPQPS